MDTSLSVSAWHELLCMFLPAFTAAGRPLFVNLLTGWVLATGRRTISGIVPFADPRGQHSHDAYHYFLREAWWFTDSLWRRWAVFAIAQWAPSGRVPLDLDDTLFHKSGRRVAGAGWWRDAVRSTGTRTVHALGLNLVVLTLRVTPPWGGEPLGLPINLRLHRKDGPDLLKLALEMLEEVAAWLPQRQFSLCADGFYAPLAGRELPRTVFTSRLRRDAALYALPPARRVGQRGRPRTKGARLPTPRATAAHVQHWEKVTLLARGRPRERWLYARRVLWYQVCGSQPVLLVIVRDPAGKEPDDFFFTTDLTAAPRTVPETTAGRWSIEDTFRNVKQCLGGEEPQTWKGAGPERAAALSFLLYSLVWGWYLLSARRLSLSACATHYAGKKHPSFQDALYALRRDLWRARIFRRSEAPFVPAEKVRLLIAALAACA